MRILCLVCLFLLFSCSGKQDKELKSQIWRAQLEVQDNQKLPFLFYINADTTVTILNAEERIRLDDVSIFQDSILIKFPVFEGYIKGKYSDKNIDGNFIKEGLDRVVVLEAHANINERFEVQNQKTEFNINGNWEVNFSPGTSEHYIAKGIFTQSGNKLTGTFRTTTGDYRYLEGVLDKDSLKLSTFDGAHAFLFKAQVTDSTMNGVFYSGNHWKEPWMAKRNQSYELPNEDSLTFLKPGYNKLDFSFNDLQGNKLGLDNSRFKNKVVIVQIMGSWCPNCLDETRFLSDFYKKNKQKGVEVVALAFEYVKSEERAIENLQRLKTKLEVDYPILLTQYGSVDKKIAAEKLPMLNHILSYPTTIFIDKQGMVRKIHTGFNGPATGKKYETFKSMFASYVEKLLSE